MRFDWDNAKRLANLRKHGVDFVDAARLMLDRPCVSVSPNSGSDDRRFIAVGVLDGRLYTVIYTQRGDVCRLISARKASDGEKKKYRAIHGK